MQARNKVGRAEAARWLGALEMLRLVRSRPGLTRTEASRALGIASGTATEICARLRDQELLSERPAPPAGRGRPTTTLHAHPNGPLAAVVDIRHADWRVAAADLEGRLSDPVTGRHRDRRPEAVIPDLRAAVAELARRHGPRLRVVAISVTATVRHSRIAQASGMGWSDVEIGPMLEGVPQTVSNDANLAGLAEARRAHPGKTVLYLMIEAGIGGVLVDRGRAVTGATGAGGEFGHLPFGERTLRCPCGALGCWDLTVDGRALARHLGAPPPSDPRTYAKAVLDRTDAAARAAVEHAAENLGRGIAGLVNALDPQVVTLGGLAVPLRGAAPGAFAEAFVDGLMTFRRATPPPLRAAALGDDAALHGAAATALDAVLTEESLSTWARLRGA